MDFLYLNDCNISDDLKTKLSDLAVQDEVAFLRCAKAYSAGNSAVMKKLNDLQCLAVALKAFEFTHKKYEEKGIEDSIFFDTLSDLGIWCRNNHNEALKIIIGSGIMFLSNFSSSAGFSFRSMNVKILRCVTQSFRLNTVIRY